MMTTPLRLVWALKKCIVIFIVCSFVSVPGVVFSQVQEEQDLSTGSSTQENPATPAATAPSPWGANSAASRIGSTSVIPPSAPQQDPQGSPANVQGGQGSTRTSTGGIRLRPAGASTDGRDPGGNPDVPFDDNMNLCFLAVGLLFSAWVIRKKLILKPARIN